MSSKQIAHTGKRKGRGQGVSLSGPLSARIPEPASILFLLHISPTGSELKTKEVMG